MNSAQIVEKLEQDERWVFKYPKRSEHIRVSRGIYYHHGVYISDLEVIHFTGANSDNVLDWSENEVIMTSLDEFLRGDLLEVKEYTFEELNDLYPEEHIIMYSRACLGERGYNLIFNNCEHFANTCTLGRFRSKQVEKVFTAIALCILSPIKPIIPGSPRLPGTRGEFNMGLFGAVGKVIKNIFGSASNSNGGRAITSSTYNYEPDKVAIAEIEANSKLRLAGMEHERIELMKKAELELFEFNMNSQIAIEEAKARGFSAIAQSIVLMQEKLNEIAEQRIRIIEHGSLAIIREIEKIYENIGDKIKMEDDQYNEEKLPKLLGMLEKYEVGSVSHELYRNRIEKDMELQAQHYHLELTSVLERQKMIIGGFLVNKERITEQTSQITHDVLERLSLKDNEESQSSSRLLSSGNKRSEEG